jgi:DNA-binding transcriptional LysR family regulator
MPAGFELWQLRYFVAVAEEGSFRRAAERLAVTQPPLTRQLQALEALVGHALLERSRRGVVPTAAGAALLVRSRALLADADAMLAQARRGAAGAARLRLGITTVVDAAQFDWIEPALQAAWPGLRVEPRRQISQASVADLRRGALDAALIGLPSETAGLVVERLTDDPLVAALPRTHPAARRRAVALADLGHDTLFWFERRLNPAYFDHFERVFARLGFRPGRAPEPADHHVLLGLVAAGRGVALVPRSLTSISREGVAYRPLREDPRDFQIGLALATRAGEPAPATALLRRILAGRYGAPG